MAQQSLLAVALSARSYAQAAVRSGFLVFVIDGFLDQETLALTKHVQLVQFNEKGFDANAFKVALETFNTNQFFGCIYGSGFEAQPELLALIQQKMPLFGNAPEIVQKVKNATSFFATLDALKISYPLVFTQLPKHQLPPNFLVKSSHGAGGQHIRHARFIDALDSSDYLQEIINGESVSVLFLVEKGANFKAHVIGFNLQWTNPTHEQPYRFGGIASNYNLSKKIKNQLCDILQKLSEAFKLAGLNSLDVVIRDEKIFVLEINPRLSASVDLYAQDLLEQFNLDLMQLHIQTCMGEKLSETAQKQLSELPKKLDSKALAIVYSQHDLTLNDIDWPNWVNDKPMQGATVLKEFPLCTVISQESSALLAKSVTKSRVKSINDVLSIVR